MKKDLLSLEDVTRKDLDRIFELAAAMKVDPLGYQDLSGKSVGIIFAKSSTRTRLSFEVGVYQMGGFPLILDQGKTQMGRGETIEDTAKVMSRYLDCIVIRTFSHQDVEQLAAYSSVPVINALTDDYHPCQAITDLFTIWEIDKNLEGKKLAFLGDGACNMSNSLVLACKLAGMNVSVGSPEEFRPSDDILNSNIGPGIADWSSDPFEAVRGADYVYTDVFVSMGCEDEAKERLAKLMPYQVSADIMAHAGKNAKFLHCLPAHRGEEVAAEVIDSDASVVFDQAENRLHVQKAIMSLLMKK